MSLVSFASLNTLDNKKEDLIDKYYRPVPIHQGESLIFSNRRLRRSRASNIALNLPNFKQNNDHEIRTSTQDMFQKYLSHLRRYLPKSIKRFNDYIFHNGSSQHDDNDNGRNNGYANNFNNDNGNKIATLRLLDALNELHRQISDYVPMQLGQSTKGDPEQSSKLTAAISSSDNVYIDKNLIDVDVLKVNSHSFPHTGAEDGNEPGLHIPRSSAYASATSSAVTNSGFPGEAADDDFGYEKDLGGYRSVHRSRRHKRDIDNDDDDANMRRELHHSKEMEIAHKLHYASVCVVSILVIEVRVVVNLRGCLSSWLSVSVVFYLSDCLSQ